MVTFSCIWSILVWVLQFAYITSVVEWYIRTVGFLLHIFSASSSFITFKSVPVSSIWRLSPSLYILLATSLSVIGLFLDLIREMLELFYSSVSTCRFPLARQYICFLRVTFCRYHIDLTVVRFQFRYILVSQISTNIILIILLMVSKLLPILA